ncbi:MAG: DUF1622 domain-containing protein [Cyanobacteriota bacterium]|nr:DUF1622 domain-containing protein [Cyanobacteriota bacterium]
MEPFVRNLIDIAISTCQLLALFVISIGLIKGLIIFLRNALSFTNSAKMFQESRLQMGYSFSLGLNFLVGGSILRTTITPSWEDIGRLAVIIVIRTVLNYLLLQNIHKPIRKENSLESDNYNNSSNKSLYENVKNKIV